MKEVYSTPTMEAIEFTRLDVITTSTEESTTDWIPRENGDQMENSGWNFDI